MKKLILGLLVLGLTTQFYAQVLNNSELPEVEVFAVNYKYLNRVTSTVMDPDVISLEREVANFDYRNSEMYSDDYGEFSMSFYIPNGMIVANFDKDGVIVETIERFENVRPPTSVNKVISNKYPGWVITKDIYKVNYHQDKGVNQMYKLTIENGSKKMHVKTDGKGNIL